MHSPTRLANDVLFIQRFIRSHPHTHGDLFNAATRLDHVDIDALRIVIEGIRSRGAGPNPFAIDAACTRLEDALQLRGANHDESTRHAIQSRLDAA